jgi:hypothetical protein
VRKTRAAMAQFCNYYNLLRTQRHHPGPEIAGVRVYRATFYLKDDAGNATKADVRELLLEAAAPTKKRKGAAATTTTTKPSTRPVRRHVVGPATPPAPGDPNDPFSDDPGDDQ